MSLECNQCNYNFFIKNGSVCKVCEFLDITRKSVRCSICEAESCDLFCQSCPKSGYHMQCYRKLRKKKPSITEDNTFICLSCQKNSSTSSITCGQCSKTFDKEDDDYSVGDELLSEVDNSFYNVKVIATDEKKVQVHFIGWSSKWDRILSKEANTLHSSISCDSCKAWFHIKCLSSFGPQGRPSKSPFVCHFCLSRMVSKKRKNMKRRVKKQQRTEKKQLICIQERKKKQQAMKLAREKDVELPISDALVSLLFLMENPPIKSSQQMDYGTQNFHILQAVARCSIELDDDVTANIQQENLRREIYVMLCHLEAIGLLDTASARKLKADTKSTSPCFDSLKRLYTDHKDLSQEEFVVHLSTLASSNCYSNQ